MLPTLNLDQLCVDYDEWVSPFAADTLQKLDHFATEHRLYTSVHLPQERTLHAHSSVNDYMFPRAPPDRLYATGLMMIYFFVFDHIYDTEFAWAAELSDIRLYLSDHIVEAIHGMPCQTGDYERAFANILQRFRDEPESWRSGFFEQLVRYIQATLLGKEAAHAKPEMSIDEYLELRQYDSGGMWSAYLIEYAHRQYLTPEQRHHPDVARARQLSIWSCSLLNDLFSYAKEKTTENAPFNAITFAQYEQGLTEVEAAKTICNRVNQFITDFEMLTSTPFFYMSEPLVSYVQGLREFISGMWYWHQKSGLYVHPHALFKELRESPIG